METTNIAPISWQRLKQSHSISLDWSDPINLTEYNINSNRDIVQLFHHQIHEYNKTNEIDLIAHQAYQFYHDIKKGDIILAQNGSTLLGVGEISGDYTFDIGNTSPHSRSVHWIIPEPNGINVDCHYDDGIKIIEPKTIQQIDTLLDTFLTHNPEEQTLNRILYGPSGTGKTYKAIRKALEICGQDISSLDRDSTNLLFNTLISNGQIAFTTFHKNTTYGDFMEKLTPHTSDIGECTHTIQDGIFKSLCTQARTPNQINFDQCYRQLVKNIQQKDGNIKIKYPNGKKEFLINLNPKGDLNIFNDTHAHPIALLTKNNIKKYIAGNLPNNAQFDPWQGYYSGVIDI